MNHDTAYGRLMNLGAAQHLGSQHLGETTVGLADFTLEEADDRLREVEFFGTSQHILLGQVVLHHELSEIADDL